MKIRLSIVVMSVIGVAVFLILRSQPSSPSIRIALSSDPFPLIIGSSNLILSVTKDGIPVDAELKVSANMMMEGMLPVSTQPAVHISDAYQVAVMWPMTGSWMVDVTAKLPGIETPVSESFEIYVYSTPVDHPGGPLHFQSQSENDALKSDPQHEMLIVIPQGTRILMGLGQAPDLIPPKVHLDVNGLNTLIIQNNDITDHTIGPYMIRAGETLRQTFTRPVKLEGKCSVNAHATVSIIVDG